MIKWPVRLAVLLVCLVASPALAQQGQINGVITDSSGGVVPGATVTAVEQATGLSRETLTGANGLYTFPSLRPTTYEIRAALTGFRSVRRTNIELLANQNLSVNLTLELGELNETVLVAGKCKWTSHQPPSVKSSTMRASSNCRSTGATRRN